MDTADVVGGARGELGQRVAIGCIDARGVPFTAAADDLVPCRHRAVAVDVACEHAHPFGGEAERDAAADAAPAPDDDRPPSVQHLHGAGYYRLTKQLTSDDASAQAAGVPQ